MALIRDDLVSSAGELIKSINHRTFSERFQAYLRDLDRRQRLFARFLDESD
jgi:hypothetical protein